MSTRQNSSLRTQREIQRDQDRRDAQGKTKVKAKRGKDKPAVQVGERRQPARLSAQHVDKPGLESELALAPRFQAPDYRGSAKLQDFAALITGADSGIGRAVAVLFAREGADVAVAYHSSTEDALETQRCVEAEGRRCLLLQGDDGHQGGRSRPDQGAGKQPRRPRHPCQRGRARARVDTAEPVRPAGREGG